MDAEIIHQQLSESTVEDWLINRDITLLPMNENSAENPQFGLPKKGICSDITVENPHPDGRASKLLELRFPEEIHEEFHINEEILDECDIKPIELGFSGETCLKVFTKDPGPDASDCVKEAKEELESSEMNDREIGAVEQLSNGFDSSKVGLRVLESFGISSTCIEEDMGKVSLVGVCHEVSADSNILRGTEISRPVMMDQCLEEAVSNENVIGESRDTDTTIENNSESGEISRDDSDSVISVDSGSEDSSTSESEDSSTSSGEEETDSDDDADDSNSDDDNDNDNDERREEKEMEMDEVEEVEEGEIRDVEEVETRVSNRENAVASSDDEEGGISKGPVKSKHELEVLPPVLPVDVSLEPQHQMLPVGVVLSIIGEKVIVEGLEKHSPLNEGSILWITATRSPLGLVDEIFGPVKNPYYVVRFNSEKELPDGIQEGIAVSFVAEFADHILNEKALYKKGYDASGENDEEVSDAVEFSDDEKEAEYKRSLQMAKKGKKDRCGNREFDGERRVQKGRFHKNFQHSAPVAPATAGPPTPMGVSVPFVSGQFQMSQVPGPFGCGSCGCASSSGQLGPSGLVSVPQILHGAQIAGLGGLPQHMLLQSNAVWTNGSPAQHQNMGLHNGFPINGAPHQQPPGHQLHMLSGLPNGISCQQAFNPSQTLLPTAPSPCGQPNPCVRPSNTNLPGFMADNCFNQVPFGIGIPGQQVHHLHTGMNGQGVPGIEAFNVQLPPGPTQGEFCASRQFNMGTRYNRGRKPYTRGGHGKFSGRHGLRPNR